jgi:hypothetical protein
MTNEVDSALVESRESGWWVLAKVALFIAVPTAIVFLVKLFLS